MHNNVSLDYCVISLNLQNRRSWVDDARTNSQFVIGSESGGNESDNSNEEPLSIASDTHLLQRNIPLRQSLQR